ncbi:hypothetical protein [Kitasatospora cheerisanensis]|uniref:Uncharacterized protein n=1 Tax=Kitasatospora cheerisanensis KCTC 2395 TaxID=1348663 RepID=A0A066YZ43_9ACTN|nr:hypothetical protein [Kitasatospora cheerisanensis]KDN86522.1 hypothetical protein KCH_16180 [Kitasatospora cheerisanensis KCTC 2395]
MLGAVLRRLRGRPPLAAAVLFTMPPGAGRPTAARLRFVEET